VGLGDPSRPPSPDNPDDFLVVGAAPSRKVTWPTGETWIFRVDSKGVPQPGFRTAGLGLAQPYGIRRFGDTILLVGTTLRAEDFQAGKPVPGWLVRLDANGQPLWERSYTFDPPTDVVLRDIAVGQTSWLAVGSHLISVDPSGTAHWAKLPGSPLDMRSIDSRQFEVQSLTSGGQKVVGPVDWKFSYFAVAGFVDFAPWVAEFDESGAASWQKYYPTHRPNDALGFFTTRRTNRDRIAAAASSWGNTDPRGAVVTSEISWGTTPCGIERDIPFEPRCPQTNIIPPDDQPLGLQVTEFTIADNPELSFEQRCDVVTSQ
jgi:hypothetical protein